MHHYNAQAGRQGYITELYPFYPLIGMILVIQRWIESIPSVSKTKSEFMAFKNFKMIYFASIERRRSQKKGME